MTDNQTTAMPGLWEVVWLQGDKLGSPSEICVAGTDNRVAFLASDGNLGTARLIAAAPDLLAALKAAEGHLEEMRQDKKWHPIEHCPVLDQVRRAIEAAEGR